MTIKAYPKIVSILLLISFTLLFIKDVQAISYPAIVSSTPSPNNLHTPIDSVITVTYNDKVKNVYSSLVKLYEKTNLGYTKEVFLQDVKKDNNSIKLITLNELKLNKEYKVVVPAYVVELNNGYYPHEYTFTFSTNYMEFYELMVLNEAKLTQVLSIYSPRQLKVFAPKRHIEEVHILHKNKGKFEDNQIATDGVTNIDIKTTGTEVKNVHVDIKKDGRLVNKGFAREFNYDPKTESLSFDIGFSKMPGYYDVIVRVFDSNNLEIDSKTIKFGATDGKLITDIKETYKYETAGKSFTLQQLLSDEKLFNTLMKENAIRKLKVQVNSRP